MSAALASKDCDLEASVEELVGYSRAQVAGGLRESLVSIFPPSPSFGEVVA